MNGRIEDECIVITLDGERYGWAIVNPLDVPLSRHAREKLFAFSFGAYGSTKCLVWQLSLDDALEEAAGWLATYAVGIFHEVKSEEDEVDMTYTESGWIPSWEWSVDELSAGDPLYDAALTESKKAYIAQYGDEDLTPNHSSAPSGGLADEEKTLREFVQYAAESNDLPNVRSAEVNDDVLEQARAYDIALYAALQDLVRVHPPKDDADADDLWRAEAPYLVLMTLRGEGVGIWDGDWDSFYDETDQVEKFLKPRLKKFADGSGSGKLDEAFTEAAYEFCQ